MKLFTIELLKQSLNTFPFDNRLLYEFQNIISIKAENQSGYGSGLSQESVTKSSTIQTSISTILKQVIRGTEFKNSS